MTLSIYRQIIKLRDEENDIKRGRDFESLMREIQPWDNRPPVVSIQESEQIDGVFVYKATTYILEAKAVKQKITPGMKEWEDFELKLRRRKGHVVGLYCCLFETTQKTVDRGRDLNMEGFQTIIVSGSTWNQLAESGLDFQYFLDYMMVLSKIKFKPALDSIKTALAWIYESTVIDEHLKGNAQKISSSFLRRFKHKYHQQLFVERSIDRQVKSLIKIVSPQSLKLHRHKEARKQVLLIRDSSGSGKTTLSVNLVCVSDYCYCFAATANLAPVDEVLDNFFMHNKYPKHGLNELLAVNKPLMFIIDSLDETPTYQHAQKRREIKSLFKKVEELNEDAVENGLAFYPIIITFTIREEYWRYWETVFEGRQDVIHLKKLLANFNVEEFKNALSNYSKAYNFKIFNPLNKEAEEILSVPINLEIFSEANNYEGPIIVEEIWEGKILSSYFKKKQEFLSKHHVERFNNERFYRLLCLLAYRSLINKTTLFSKHEFKEIVKNHISGMEDDADAILLNLLSEQIVINEPEDDKNYRFKYVRFIEYLVALHIIQQVGIESNLALIDTFIQVIYDSSIVSIYSVLNNMRLISKSDYSDIENQIIVYYSHSEKFLHSFLPEVRGKIARGSEVSEKDIKTLITNNYTQSAYTSWNSFFILAAKPAKVKVDTIISSFSVAWTSNIHNPERWRIINKLGACNLLLHEKILMTLLRDSTARDWEELLWIVLRRNLMDDFIEIWTHIDGDSLFANISEKDKVEWQYASRLLNIIISKLTYIVGDLLSTEPPNQYVVFDAGFSKRITYLDDKIKNFCEEYVKDFTELFEMKITSPTVATYRVRTLSKEEKFYVNIKLESLLKGRFGTKDKPFLNFIVSRARKNDGLLKLVIETNNLDIFLNDADNDMISLFQEIIISDYEDKIGLLEFVFSMGYTKRPSDEIFIDRSVKENNLLTNEKYENILLGYCFLRIKHLDDYTRLNDIYKPVCILLITKFNRIFFYKFTNFLQVVNTALEHHKQFSALFLHALDFYDRKSELIDKPSFRKKAHSLSLQNVPQLHEYDSLLEAIFPELFL